MTRTPVEAFSVYDWLVAEETGEDAWGEDGGAAVAHGVWWRRGWNDDGKARCVILQHWHNEQDSIYTRIQLILIFFYSSNFRVS